MRLNKLRKIQILFFSFMIQTTAWSESIVKNKQLIPPISSQPVCEQVIHASPTHPNDHSPFKASDKIKIALSKYMQNQYSEYRDAFLSKNLKSYKTYNTKCGIFYSIEATDFSDSRAYGYCGSAGCDNFFFRQVQNDIKLVFHAYLERIETNPVVLKPDDTNCLVLKIWVSGLESKNLKRAGRDWLDGQIQFKKNKVELVLNDP